MDLIYVGLLAVFALLIMLMIEGCGRLGGDK